MLPTALAMVLVAVVVATILWPKKPPRELDVDAPLSELGYRRTPQALLDPDGRICGCLAGEHTRASFRCDAHGPLVVGSFPQEYPGLPQSAGLALREGSEEHARQAFGEAGWKQTVGQSEASVVSLEEGELQVVWHRKVDGGQLVFLMETARALRDAMERERLGALLDAGFVRREPDLVGSWRGVSMRVRLFEEGFEVEAEHRADLSAVHRDHTAEQAATGNPVVDQLIVASGRDLEALLADPAGLEILLEVVHGRPGSELAPGTLLVGYEGPIPPALDQVHALCEALNTAADGVLSPDASTDRDELR